MFAKLANRQTMVIGKYRASDSAPGVGAVDPVNAAILEQKISLSRVRHSQGWKPFDHSAYPHAEPLRRSFSDLREHPAHQWGEPDSHLP